MPYGFVLDENEKRELLRIARATLKEFMSSGRVPPGAPHRKSMTEPAGVFVTLRAAGELRGRSGTAAEGAPLYKAIQEHAIAAATRDARFQPVRPEELAALTIALAVLGARQAVTEVAAIRVGEHGVSVTAGRGHGVILPDEAASHGWDAQALLAKACEQANVPPERWREAGVLVESFTAQSFSEK